MALVTDPGPAAGEAVDAERRRPPPGSYVPGELVGGPLGRHAFRAGWWSALTVLVLATVLTCLAGYGVKFPCRDSRNWTHHYEYTRVCYSDVIPLYSSEKLAQGKVPYIDEAVEYPVLIGAAMEAGAKVAEIAPANDFVARNALFFDATAILLTIAAIAAVLCTALTAGRRRMDAILFAAAPILAFNAFTNWDLIAIAFTAAGMLAWSKKAPALAGLFIGLGAATKAYPLLLLVVIGLLAYRAGRLRAWLRCSVWAVGVVVVIYGMVWPFAGSYLGANGHRYNNLWKFVELNQTRGPDWGSLGYVVQYLGRTATTGRIVSVSAALGLILIAAVALWRRSIGAVLVTFGIAILGVAGVTQATSYSRQHGGISASALNTAGLVAMLVVFALVGYVVLTAPRRPRVPQVAFLVVAGFLLTNKVYSPQYALWLLPLAALAYPRWRPLLAWQLAELLQLLATYLWFVYDAPDEVGKAGIGEGWYVSAVVFRDVVLLGLVALIVREIYRPELDVVRQDGVDDPAGGLLDGVPDRHVFA